MCLPGGHDIREPCARNENHEIEPVVSGIYPLDRIVEAQKVFMQTSFIGKLVLEPPGDNEHED